jgi:hypothetical protein
MIQRFIRRLIWSIGMRRAYDYVSVEWLEERRGRNEDTV